MKKELSPAMVQALIAAAVLIALGLGFFLFRRSDPSSGSFGTPPPGEIARKMQEGQQRGSQQAAQQAAQQGQRRQ